MKITILGSGSSKGIPEAGNYWGEADPQDIRNHRTRTSLLLSFDNHNFLIDAGPDFRYQLNRNNISTINSVLFTHGHSDHIDGLSDLLWIIKNQDKDIDLYASKETYDAIMHRYAELFHPVYGDKNSHRAHWHIIEEGAEIKVHTETFKTFPVIHYILEPTAIRWKNFCYVPDFNILDDRAINNLDNLDCLVINANDGFEVNPKSSQSNFYEIFELNEKIKAKRVILNHLKISVDHERDEKKMPSGFEIAYDGLIVNI